MCEKRVENRIQANHSQKEHQPADKSERKQDDCCNKYNYRDVVGQQHINDVTTRSYVYVTGLVAVATAIAAASADERLLVEEDSGVDMVSRLLG